MDRAACQFDVLEDICAAGLGFAQNVSVSIGNAGPAACAAAIDAD
jgi:hypothetical protein